MDGRDYNGFGYVASALTRRPLLLLGAPALLWASSRGRRLLQAERLALSLLAASVALALVAGGDWMPNRRLLVVALPLAAVVFAFALARAPAPLCWAACFALGAEALASTDRALDQTWRHDEWLDQRVESWFPARPFVDPYALDWMPAHLLRELAPYVGPGDIVAHVDMGELPYVMADVAFLDGFGLVEREAARVTFTPGDPGRQAAAREAFFRADPAAAIVVLDATTGHPISVAQAVVLADPRFVAGWRELSRVPTWGNHPCVVYVRRATLPAPPALVRDRLRGWMGGVPDVL